MIARGIERAALFRDRGDREEFVRRLVAVVRSDGAAVHAWALLPNHVHLLLRTGQAPLARLMRALLAGYAGAFNRHRVGHLFQNRYKSIVEEEPGFLEPVRSLRLNALRAKVVADLRALDRYAYGGPAPLIAAVARALSISLPAVLQAAPRGEAILAGNQKEIRAVLSALRLPTPPASRARSVA